MEAKVKRVMFLVVAALLAMPVFGTGTTEKTSQDKLAAYGNAGRAETFIIADNSGFEITNLNSYVPTDSSGMLWSAAPLFQQNQGTGKIEGRLALSYAPSADFSQWTVKLRTDAYWTDGTRWNADDVLAHFSVVERFEEASLHSEYLNKIKKLEKVGDYEVRFTLNKADPYFHITFLSNNRYTSVSPARVLNKIKDLASWTNMGDFEGDKLPIHMGPYLLYRYTQNRTEYVRDDNWWAAKAGFMSLPSPKKVVIVYLGARDVTLQAGIDNEVDHIPFGLMSEFNAIRARNPKWSAWSEEIAGWEDMAIRFLMWNLECPPPWNDPEMRKAVQLVIDKKTLAELSSGIYGPATSVFPGYPALAAYDALVSAEDKRDLVGQDTGRASSILRSKGYTLVDGKWMKDGKQLALNIYSPEYPDVFVTGEIVAEQLIRFGIDATNRKMAGSPWTESLYNGDYTVAPGWHFLGALYEPYSTLRRATMDYYQPVGTRATTNIWRYNNQAYTDAVRELATVAPDSPRAMQLTKIALDLVFDEMFVIPLHKNYFIYMNNETYWTNYSSKKNSYSHPDLWTMEHIAGLKPAR